MSSTRNIYAKFLATFFLALIILGSLVACTTGSTSPPSVSISPEQSSLVPKNKELIVFAGSASKPPLDETARLFQKRTGTQVYLTYGGSGAVLSQMKLSQTGDVYIPGSPDYLLKAQKENVIDSSSTKIIAYLVPAIGVQRGNPKNIQTLTDLTKPGIKVGIGNPAAVCVGLYAIEIFDHNNLLTDVNKNIVTQAESCEKTATLLSLKSVDAIIGWDVFDNWDPENIEVIYLKPEQIPRIAYVPAAISKYTKDNKSAEAFIDFLISADGQNIFQKWGYLASEQETRKFSPNARIGGEYSLPETYKK
jgi:molybdate transport system substrate-binding protein